MTTWKLLLSLSLLANLALVAAYLFAPSRQATDLVQAPVASARVVDLTMSDGAHEVSATRSAQQMHSWATIDTPDIDELARRLKAAEFSPAEIRLILRRRIFSSSQTSTDAKPKPYWRATYRYESSAGRNDEQRKQAAERQRLSRKYLIGPENIAGDPEQLAAAKRHWGELPIEKLQAIARIDADYQEMSVKQYIERSDRPGETGGIDTFRLMEKERLADIAKVLSPEEYAAYELRASPTASLLRYQLETFRPTEEEYKAIFAIKKTYQDQLYDPRLSADARKALNAEITAKVGAALGAERALDYDAAVNENSQDKTAGLVSRLGLPARVASEVRQVQQDLTQRAKEIRANPQLAPNDRSAQLSALARQAETQLTAKLGADGFEAYFDIKGDWLRELQPKGP